MPCLSEIICVSESFLSCSVSLCLSHSWQKRCCCSQSLLDIDFYWFLPEPPVLLVKPVVSFPSVNEQTGDVPKQSSGSGSGPIEFFKNGSVSAVWRWIHFWSSVYCNLIQCVHSGCQKQSTVGLMQSDWSTERANSSQQVQLTSTLTARRAALG